MRWRRVSFLLLWRVTRDVFTAKIFHTKCDGKPNTLTIVKSKTGFIFGAYTSIPWSSPSSSAWGPSDPTALLFTLTNPANMPLKLKIKAGQEQYAVLHGIGYGPAFGDGHSLLVYDESTSKLCPRPT